MQLLGLNGKIFNMPNKLFWKGKKVFLTGHSGFKGSWMSLWLNSMEAEVKGYALNPITQKSLFELCKIESLIHSEINDIRDYESLHKSINDFMPDLVIHMAAQPLVRDSYLNPLDTFNINVIGTANILEICRKTKSVKALLNVTTDKCYLNEEYGDPFKEEDKLGGHDPYSSSKACSELVTSSYLNSFYIDQRIGLATARAGNVIGGGDWAKDRLVPDILKAHEEKEGLILRNPRSTRPWQHVLEPLNGYLMLMEALFESKEDFSGPWNFGPDLNDVITVESLARKLSDCLGNIDITFKEDNEMHESNTLSLNTDKAKRDLEWFPKLNINSALKMVASWHDNFLNKADTRRLCLDQISEYEKL